ncbi:MAG TPA: hypothetical protein VMJ32_08770 [Pirellulales bacterium]|nr:hypothetical protein [Pirellulales bacterium]
MSSQETPITIESSAATADELAADCGVAPTFWRRLASKAEWAGEWLNPLLVKEVRQSLKSRQFSITFSAVLCLSWLWSIAGITRLGPEVSYGAYGPDMFYVYYLILAFPLILIVPFSTFRSLIAEREDNTYELVAITTLRPRQIVAGKLGSSVAQMAVYFSAVAPCLAFTYLLRGIDVPTICWILFDTFLASLGFSMCALLLATIAKEKHWQILLAVVIIVTLFSAFQGARQLCWERLRNPRLEFSSSEFWMENLTFLSFYVSTFVLLYFAAAAQLTFTAENRSTPLRWAMLAQQVLFIGWIGFGALKTMSQNRSMAAGVGFLGVIAVVVASMYWFVMGGFMSGEATELSPRVKRRLPQSDLGRALFTLFNPGAGTGYLFAVSNVAAISVLAICAVWYGEASGGSTATGLAPPSQLITQILLLVGYFVLYLGVGNLLLRLLRRFTQVTLSAGVLVNLLLVMAGWGIPGIIDPYDIHRSTYNLGHLTDPYWSCIATIDPRISTVHDELLVIILPAAALVFLWNLVYIVPEIRQVRMLPPPRVIEEEQALAPAQPTHPQPASPWD